MMPDGADPCLGYQELCTKLREIHVLAEIKTAGDKGKGSMSERLEKIWDLSK
jgi:hypothetical protein